MERLGYSKTMDGEGSKEQTTNAKPLSEWGKERRELLKQGVKLGIGGAIAALFGWHVLGPKMQEARAASQNQSNQTNPEPEPQIPDPQEQLRKRQLQDELNEQVVKQGGQPEFGPSAGKGR